MSFLKQAASSLQVLSRPASRAALSSRFAVASSQHANLPLRSSKWMGKQRALELPVTSAYYSTASGATPEASSSASGSAQPQASPEASSQDAKPQGASSTPFSAAAGADNSFSVLDMYMREISGPAPSRALTPEAFEDAFRNRPRKGWGSPTNSTSGRSVSVSNGDVSTAYRLMSAVLNRNQIRKELRLGDRYEKPNQERRRKISERHRRRFADMVRKKVQLVMKMRKRGE